MGWETKGKPVLEDGLFGEEFVAYVNAYWIDGEVIGGVYSTEEEACAAARALILELGMLSGEDKILDGMDGAELEDRINESERVGFAQVAQRDVLFS